MPSMIQIANDGPLLKSTSYWQSAYARRGAVFLSMNAGAWRILVPPALAASALPEMRTGKEVIFSRGPWEAMGRAEAIEVMFEDGSDTPYALHVGQEQWDRLPLDEDQGHPIRALVYTAGGLQLELPGRYRRVAELPCMLSWAEH